MCFTITLKIINLHNINPIIFAFQIFGIKFILILESHFQAIQDDITVNSLKFCSLNVNMNLFSSKYSFIEYSIPANIVLG